MGNDLWSVCSCKSAVQSGLCMGFVMGIADAMSTGNAILGTMMCLPEHVTGEQAQDVVKQFLEQHPERRHYTATTIAADALKEAFPCKP
jgi:hypothetical protein